MVEVRATGASVYSSEEASVVDERGSWFASGPSTKPAAIDAGLDHGLSNALIESTNTKIRLLARVAFGFHGPEPLIALAMLALGGHKPNLPHRQ